MALGIVPASGGAGLETAVGSLAMSSPGVPTEVEHLVERFDHLALAVRDPRSVIPLLAFLGGEYHNGGHHPTAGFRWIQFLLPAGPKIEILSPLDPEDGDHFLNRFFSSRGEGPHHVTFKVADLQAAVATLRDLGYQVVGEDYENAGWREAFLHPGSAHGLLIQLAEWTDGPFEPRPLEDVLAAP